MSNAGGVEGVVYLIHFERPLEHARHYIGWTADLEQRVADHQRGRGSKLIAAVVRAGIAFRVVRTWSGTRAFERKLKNRKETPRLCPVCAGKRAKPVKGGKPCES